MPGLRRALFALLLALASTTWALDPLVEPLACGTHADMVLVPEAGQVEARGPKSCHDGLCKMPVRYRSFVGDRFDLVAFTGDDTEWLVPAADATAFEPDAALLVRNSDSQYRYFRDLLGREPAPNPHNSGASHLTIAMVPCHQEQCERDGGGTVSARGKLGAKGIELYFGEALNRTWQQRVDILTLVTGRLGRDEYLIAHEMAHNFDLGASARLRVTDAQHAWTALLVAQAVKDWTPTLGRTSFYEYDISVLDYADIGEVARRYTEQQLTPNAADPSSALADCIDSGQCDRLTGAARSVIAALVLRVDALLDNGVLGRWLQRQVSRAGTLTTDAMFTELAELSNANLGCAADALHLPLAVATKQFMQTRYGTPVHCGDADADGLADWVDTRIDLVASPITSLSRESGTTVVVPRLPARLTGSALPRENAEVLAFPLDDDQVLHYRSCASQGRFEVEHDLAGGPPERPDYRFISPTPASDCQQGRVLPFRGQQQARLRLIGPAEFDLSLWTAAVEPRQDGPYALAHLVITPRGRELDWRLLRPERLPGNWDAVGVREGMRDLHLPAADRTRVPLPEPQRRGLLEVVALRGGTRVAAPLIPTFEVTDPIAGPDPASAVAGVWFKPDAPGWGLQLDVGRSGTARVMTAAVYSFRGNSRSIDPLGGQSWLVGAATVTEPLQDLPVLRLDYGTASTLRAAGEAMQTTPWGHLVLQRDGEGLLVHFFGQSGYRGAARLVRLVAPVDSPLAGLWYDRGHPGTGWSLSASDGVLIAGWYRYRDDDQRQQWLVGAGDRSAEARSASVEVFGAAGGRFADRHGSDLPQQEPWGRLSFTLLDCDTLQIVAEPLSGTIQRTIAKRLLAAESACRL